MWYTHIHTHTFYCHGLTLYSHFHIHPLYAPLSLTGPFNRGQRGDVRDSTQHPASCCCPIISGSSVQFTREHKSSPSPRQTAESFTKQQLSNTVFITSITIDIYSHSIIFNNWKSVHVFLLDDSCRCRRVGAVCEQSSSSSSSPINRRIPLRGKTQVSLTHLKLNLLSQINLPLSSEVYMQMSFLFLFFIFFYFFIAEPGAVWQFGKCLWHIGPFLYFPKNKDNNPKILLINSSDMLAGHLHYKLWSWSRLRLG